MSMRSGVEWRQTNSNTNKGSEISMQSIRNNHQIPIFQAKFPNTKSLEIIFHLQELYIRKTKYIWLIAIGWWDHQIPIYLPVPIAKTCPAFGERLKVNYCIKMKRPLELLPACKCIHPKHKKSKYSFGKLALFSCAILNYIEWMRLYLRKMINTKILIWGQKEWNTNNIQRSRIILWVLENCKKSRM